MEEGKVSKGIDFYINKIIPKKLLAWGIATWALMADKIDGDMWGYITLVFLGANVVGKFAHAIEKRGSSPAEYQEK